jgi:hypothetical protein
MHLVSYAAASHRQRAEGTAEEVNNEVGNASSSSSKVGRGTAQRAGVFGLALPPMHLASYAAASHRQRTAGTAEEVSNEVGDASSSSKV